VIEKLNGLRDMGLDIAIDDFGTGYSSLSYLSRFPITTLKIDRAFVHDLEFNKNTAEIARAIIALSQGLDLEVVAEGAENLAHIDFLKKQGCNTVQGFFYSRPVDAASFAVLLKQGVISKEDLA
jgi:EAL domain-containing protein (putative c-di-GMP-specific phosphodiesterase class I)